MKTNSIKKLFAIVVLTTVIKSCFSQGFVNLNFENAIVTPAYPPSNGYIYADSAIPGWTAYYSNFGTNAQPIIYYDSVSLGGAAIFLEDTNAPSGGGPLPLQGNYSILLQGFEGDTNFADGNSLTASIGQSGQIPVGTESLEFYGAGINNFQMTFDSQVISYSAIGTGSDYTIYGANISEFAGDSGELLFTALANGSGLIDNIQFLSTPVPEPSELTLGALGALLLGFRRWRSRK